MQENNISFTRDNRTKIFAESLQANKDILKSCFKPMLFFKSPMLSNSKELIILNKENNFINFQKNMQRTNGIMQEPFYISVNFKTISQKINSKEEALTIFKYVKNKTPKYFINFYLNDPFESIEEKANIIANYETLFDTEETTTPKKYVLNLENGKEILNSNITELEASFLYENEYITANQYFKWVLLPIYKDLFTDKGIKAIEKNYSVECETDIDTAKQVATKIILNKIIYFVNHEEIKTYKDYNKEELKKLKKYNDIENKDSFINKYAIYYANKEEAKKLKNMENMTPYFLAEREAEKIFTEEEQEYLNTLETEYTQQEQKLLIDETIKNTQLILKMCDNDEEALKRWHGNFKVFNETFNEILSYIIHNKYELQSAENTIYKSFTDIISYTNNKLPISYKEEIKAKISDLKEQINKYIDKEQNGEILTNKDIENYNKLEKELEQMEQKNTLIITNREKTYCAEYIPCKDKNIKYEQTESTLIYVFSKGNAKGKINLPVFFNYQTPRQEGTQSGFIGDLMESNADNVKVLINNILDQVAINSIQDKPAEVKYTMEELRKITKINDSLKSRANDIIYKIIGFISNMTFTSILYERSNELFKSTNEKNLLSVGNRKDTLPFIVNYSVKETEGQENKAIIYLKVNEGFKDVFKNIATIRLNDEGRKQLTASQTLLYDKANSMYNQNKDTINMFDLLRESSEISKKLNKDDKPHEQRNVKKILENINAINDKTQININYNEEINNINDLKTTNANIVKGLKQEPKKATKTHKKKTKRH